jgi:hypothetical protein
VVQKMEGTNPPFVVASPTALVPSTEPTAPLAPPEWSAVDDRILCDAIEGGASLEALAGAEAGTATQLDLFSVPRTLPQLQARWRQLLFDAPLAEACVARMAPAATAPSRYLAAGKGFAVHRMLPCEPLQAEASEIALAADMLSYSDAENAIVLVRNVPLQPTVTPTQSGFRGLDALTLWQPTRVCSCAGGARQRGAPPLQTAPWNQGVCWGTFIEVDATTFSHLSTLPAEWCSTSCSLFPAQPSLGLPGPHRAPEP